MGSLTLEKPVTFFVGENGTGKSTLIEAIAVATIHLEINVYHNGENHVREIQTW